MKQRIDSIIAASAVAGVVALGLTGAYALNDTSGDTPTGGGNGNPIAVYDATPEASPILEETDQPEIVELPATGAGPLSRVGAWF